MASEIDGCKATIVQMLVRPGKTLRWRTRVPLRAALFWLAGDDEPLLQREKSGGWRRGELQEVACGQGPGCANGRGSHSSQAVWKGARSQADRSSTLMLTQALTRAKAPGLPHLLAGKGQVAMTARPCRPDHV